jgi:hypothetical protein
MTHIRIQEIIDQLNDHERRLRMLESGSKRPDGVSNGREKTRTLSEIIKGKDFRSGKEKVAIIVGYYEMVLADLAIKESTVKEGWKTGKFDGKYDHNFLVRAIKDGFVRSIGGNFDLSQTGERYWDLFVKQDA